VRSSSRVTWRVKPRLWRAAGDAQALAPATEEQAAAAAAPDAAAADADEDMAPAEDEDPAADPDEGAAPADEAAGESDGGDRAAGARRQRTGGGRRAALAEGEPGEEGRGGAAGDAAEAEGRGEEGSRPAADGSYAAALAARAWPGEEPLGAGGARSRAARLRVSLSNEAEYTHALLSFVSLLQRVLAVAVARLACPDQSGALAQQVHASGCLRLTACLGRAGQGV